MRNQEMSKFLALMLAAGGPHAQLARVRWPLHKALRELYEETGRRGDRASLGLSWTLRPSADVGVEVEGADAALLRLVAIGILRAEGYARDARLILEDDAAVQLRRELMEMDPAAVRLLQRAATRWAAFS